MDEKVSKKVDKLLTKVDSVIEKQKTLAKKEEVILEGVHQEEKQEEVVEEEVEKVEAIGTMQQKLVKRLQRHKLLFPLIVGVGVVLVWRGLWELFDVTPIISYSFISLALGIVILWAINRINSL